MTVGTLITIIGIAFYFKWSYHSIKDLVENDVSSKDITIIWLALTAAYLILIITYFLVTYWNHKLF